jgi:ribosomal protein S27AE
MFAQTPLRKIRPGTGFHTAASNVGEQTAKHGTLCGIMSRRGKLNREKIRASLATTCPHCGARLEPDEYKRVDWEHLECPRCGKRFQPVSKS